MQHFLSGMDRNKRIILPEQSSNSQINVPASDSDVVPGQSSNSQINARASDSDVVPVQSSNSQINAPASSSQVVPGQSSNMQIDAPASSSQVVLGQSSNMQISPPASHSEAIPPMAGPRTLQPDEGTSEPTNTIPDNDDTGSGSNESTTSEEPEEVKEWRKRLAFYQDMFKKYYEPQAEERAEGIRKRKADEPTSGMSPQTVLEHHHTVLKKYFKKAMEEANMQGYAYGIVLGDNRVLSGSSESLRKWWNETIIFEQAGPTAVDRYYSKHQVNLDLANNDEPPQRTYDLLMKLCDATMGAILSALMSKCNPPQRRFPFENKVPPPWWPTGIESWWEETGLEREAGQPQYKKPHDLKKKWKAIIVLSVIKHLAPNFELMVKTVKSSKNLQDRLSVREMHAWNSALKEEMKIYSGVHPDMPLSNLLKAFQSHNAPAPGQSSSSLGHGATGLLQQQQQVPPMANQLRNYRMIPRAQMGMFPWSNQQRTMRFTCKNQRCLHHDNEFGFRTAALRDNHQLYCNRQNPTDQFTVPAGELSSMVPPFGSTSQVTVPPSGSSSQVTFPPFGNTSQVNVPPSCSYSQVNFPSYGSTSQMTFPPFSNTSQLNVPPSENSSQVNFPPFGSTPQVNVPPFGGTSQVTVPPMHPPQQMVQPPFQSMLPPVSTPLLQMFGQNSEMIPPQQAWAPFNADVPNYPSAPSGSLDMSQFQPDFSFGGFYDALGSSSGGGGYDTVGSYMQMINDIQPNDRLMSPQQQLHGADPSMQQHHMENFQYGGGEGSSTGVFQQTGFQPFEDTDVQYFPNDPAVEKNFSGMQPNVAVSEGTQFGQIGPLDDSLVPGQPSLGVPNISIPQASDMQQGAPNEVQNPPPSGELNQFSTGIDEFWPGSQFFQ